MAQYQAISKPLPQVFQEPQLLQGHLQPRQHRALVARLHMASLVKEMCRMDQAPVFRCRGFLGLSHLRLPRWPLWSVSQLCFSPTGLPRQALR